MVALGTENLAFREIDDKTNVRSQFFNKIQSTQDCISFTCKHTVIKVLCLKQKL